MNLQQVCKTLGCCYANEFQINFFCVIIRSYSVAGGHGPHGYETDLALAYQTGPQRTCCYYVLVSLTWRHKK